MKTQAIVATQHTSPQLAASALPESADATQILSVSQAFLSRENARRNFSFSYLESAFRSSLRVWQGQAPLQNLASQEEHFQQQLAQVRQSLSRLSQNPLQRAEAERLLDQLDRLSAFSEFETTVRQSSIFLGRSHWERAFFMVNLGASWAGHLGSALSFTRGLRGNLPLSIAAGLANAWFQVAAQVGHELYLGHEINRRDLVAEFAESGLAAVACAGVSYGLRNLTGSALWLIPLRFTMDVLTECEMNAFGISRRLLGLQHEGFNRSLEGLAYTLAANAWGELSGDLHHHVFQSLKLPNTGYGSPLFSLTFFSWVRMEWQVLHLFEKLNSLCFL